MNNFQAFFHSGGSSHKTPSPGRIAKVVHSPWTAPRDKKKQRATYDSTLCEVDEEGLQQGEQGQRSQDLDPRFITSLPVAIGGPGAADTSASTRDVQSHGGSLAGGWATQVMSERRLQVDTGSLPQDANLPQFCTSPSPPDPCTASRPALHPSAAQEASSHAQSSSSGRFPHGSAAPLAPFALGSQAGLQVSAGQPGTREVQSCNFPSQVAAPLDALMPKACSTDFAGTVGKRPAFQAAFYFGTGLVSLDSSSAEAPFGLGPLAAGAQRFTAVATCHDPLPVECQSGSSALREAFRGASAADKAATSGSILRVAAFASPMSISAGSAHSNDEHHLSPEAMELCGGTAKGGSSERRQRHVGGRRSCAAPDEEPCSPGAHQHHMLGLSPLLGRSLQKLRRSWGSGGGMIAGTSAKEASLATEACSGNPDMQPLWRGHTENVCPNAGGSPETPLETGAAQAARSGSPQRSPLRERNMLQGGNAATGASQGAQRNAGLVGQQHHGQQQHRLSRAGRQEQLEWQATSLLAREEGGEAGAVAVASGAEHTRLGRLRAVMTMSTLDASLDGATPMGCVAPMEEERGQCPGAIIAQWQVEADLVPGRALDVLETRKMLLWQTRTSDLCASIDSSSRRTTPEEQQQQQQGLVDMQSPASMSTCSSATPSSALLSPFSDINVAATPAASAVDHEELLCSQASNGDLAPLKLAANPPVNMSQALGDTIATFNDRLHEAVENGEAITVGQAWQEVQVGAGQADIDIDSLNAMLKCFCKVVADPSPAEAEELFARAGRRGIMPNAVTYHELAAIQMRHEQLGGL